MAPHNAAAAVVSKQPKAETAKGTPSAVPHAPELSSSARRGTRSVSTSDTILATTSRRALPRRAARARQPPKQNPSLAVPSSANSSNSNKKTTGKRKRSVTPATDAESAVTSGSEAPSSRTSVSDFADDAIIIDSESDDFSAVSEHSDAEESEPEPTDASDSDEAPKKKTRKTAAGRKTTARAGAAVKKPAKTTVKTAVAASKGKKARKVTVDENGEQIRDGNGHLVYESDDGGAHVHQDYVDSYTYKMLQGVTLPPISKNADIFQDLTNKAMSNNFGGVIKHLNGHKLRVATMCSGTESPILALELIVDSKSLIISE